MKNLKKIIYLLSPQEIKQAIILLIMIIIMALVEMIGVASIMPFMTMLSNPDVIETNVHLNSIFKSLNRFNISTKNEFLFIMGLSVFVLLIFSLCLKALTTYFLLKFSQMCEFSIGKRFIEGYLQQPYSWFLNRNSAELGKTILSEVQIIITNGIRPLGILISQFIVVIMLLSFVIYIDPKIAFIACLFLSTIYFLIYKLVRNFLNKIGQERFEANQHRFTAVSEAFGSAKEVKLRRLEQVFVNRFSEPSKIYAKHQASVQIIGQIPRFAIEAISFGGILILILYLISINNSFINAVPIITLYAFTGYRMLPALQQIYNSITQLRFVTPSLKALYDDFKNIQPISNLNEEKNILDLKNSIKLNHIYYNYPNSTTAVLRDLNLTIPAFSTIGFVGSTGSGKTTTVDIVLGLLDPTKGTLEVDGKIINKHDKKSWQSSLGYVPQQIYLIDNTIAANIAFGVSKKDINYTRIKEVAKIANLHEFIVNELPQQYETYVGEKGVRLSGGQRQRIGIARALYHNPKVLVFDEATSALDNMTEHEIMKTLYELKKDITIIIVAHRLNTIKMCDQIVHIEKGQIKNKGSFEELKKKDKFFQTIKDKRN